MTARTTTAQDPAETSPGRPTAAILDASAEARTADQRATNNASADASHTADRFRSTARTWARSQQALVLLAADIDDSGCWLAEGHTTPAAWIAVAADVETCTAREWLRISHALRRLPHTKAAYENNDLSYAKVRALTRVATAENEADLLPIAFEWPANQLACALAVWMRDNTDPEALDRHHQRQRSFSTRVDPDGMHRFSIAIGPETGGTLNAAIEAIVMRATPRRGERGGFGVRGCRGRSPHQGDRRRGDGVPLCSLRFDLS